MKKFFVKVLAVMLVCMFVISGFNFSVFASTESDLGEELSTMNVEISGRVSLMFYFKNLSNVSYFKVTVPNKDGSSTTKVVDKSELKYDSEKERYLLKVALAAAQQTDKVTVQAFNANGVGSSKIFKYAVTDYANKLFELASSDSSYEAAASTVRAMLNYGAMAQAYFGYNTSSLANDGLYYRGTNPVDDMAYEDLHGITNYDSTCVSTTNESVIKFTSVNAYLEDTVSLRFYLEYNGSLDPKNLTVQINGTQYDNQVMQDAQENYYILINNIPATLFNEQYRVSVSDGTYSAEMKYSVLNYLQARLAKTDDENLMNVAYSMFQFYTSASEYTGSDDVITDSYIEACRHERTYIVDSIDKPIFCSDCGKQTGNSGSYELNGSTVTSGDFSYSVGGGNFEADDDEGFVIPYGQTMTLTGNDITSNVNSNYFSLDYYASAPVKVTMTYSCTFKKSVISSSSTTTLEEVYYLEAGENLFNAFEYGSLDGRKTYYGYNSVSAFTLTSISVTPLTKDGASFVLFNYKAANKSVSFQTSTHGGAATITEKMIYTSNSRYKLGVSITYGGAISELYDLSANDGTIKSTTNLVNRYDTGRLIQQSYYGTTGATDDYVPRYYSPDGTVAWNYNPVQGGDELQNRARLIDYEVVDGKYIYIKTQPRDWACEDSSGKGINDGGRFALCYMENRYTLTDTYVQVDNRMVDFSNYNHPFTGQELPAFYTLSYFNDYYWYSGANPWANDTLTLEHNLPFWGYQANMTRTTFNYQVSNTETWGAFVNDTTGYGIGMYVPNTDVFKGGITTNHNTGEGDSGWKETRAEGSGSSYFTAQKILKIVPFEPIEYSYLICAGTVNTIRETFRANKNFASNYSLNKNDISQKLPNKQDMTHIDFSVEDNLLFLQSVMDMNPSYDTIQQAAKLTTTGGDSYFHINYSLYDMVYTTTDYSCIEFEYMIPANSTLYPYGVTNGQDLYYQVGTNTIANGNYRVGNPVTLIADGKYHTARIYTKNITGWSGKINSLRFDFLNNGIGAGQVMYIKSFSLTKSTENNVNDQYVTNLDSSYTGTKLSSQLTDGSWDFGIVSAVLCDDDFVRVVSGTGPDQYFGIILGGTATTGNYMVIKYRTTAVPTTASMQIFATAGSTTITGSNDNFIAYGLVGNGRWHTLVIDLTASGAVASGNGKLNQVRIDIFDAFPANSVIDFGYIGFCDSLTDIKVADGECVEYSRK